MQMTTRDLPNAICGSVQENFYKMNNNSSSNSNWTFSAINNITDLYRGTLSSGLHLSNFSVPLSVMPTQQVGLTVSGANNFIEGQPDLLAGLHPYNLIFGSSLLDSPMTGSLHLGDDNNNTSCHHS